MTTPSSSLHVAIAGATGAVGETLLQVLEKSPLPLGKLTLLASARSAGKEMLFRGKKHPIQRLTPDAFKGVDLAFFSAGGERSREFAPHATAAGAVVIDNSSAFRMDEKVPLVVPEVNPQAASEHQNLIANPNCSTIAMVLPLFPLHQAFGVKRVRVATYQAASGAGAQAMRELEEETQAFLNHQPYKRTIFPQSYAFNLFLHNSPLDHNLYSEEETKMIRETHKIFGDFSIAISPVCVRVPVLRAHSEALNIEFETEVSAEAACEVLYHAPGVELFGDPKKNLWPTPQDGSGKDPVLVGRVRKDISAPRTLDLWLVSDQLLKGAALNAVQIAELLFPPA